MYDISVYEAGIVPTIVPESAPIHCSECVVAHARVTEQLTRPAAALRRRAARCHTELLVARARAGCAHSTMLMRQPKNRPLTKVPCSTLKFNSAG